MHVNEVASRAEGETGAKLQLSAINSNKQAESGKLVTM
jgi:hypothetical protein